MKRKLACILAALLLTAMPLNAYAEGTTTLTTTVPAASYTLNIPADMTIPFGQVETEIGNITVSEASGFAVGKNLIVYVNYNAFTNPNVSTTIPWTITCQVDGYEADHRLTINTGSRLKFKGHEFGGLGSCFYDNLVMRNMYCNVASEDWGKALGGEYSTTITFTAEVVSE